MIHFDLRGKANAGISSENIDAEDWVCWRRFGEPQWCLAVGLAAPAEDVAAPTVQLNGSRNSDTL
jgi:hypothetical protein